MRNNIKVATKIQKYDSLIKATSAEEIEKLNKTEKMSISLSNFQPNSIILDDFSNHYKSNLEFIYYNSELFKLFKDLSNKNFNETFIDNDNRRVMRTKILDKENTVKRICKILEEGYKVNIEQLNDSKFIECGTSIGSRFIGIIRDYHIIEVLFLDPNHLVCRDDRFSIKQKLGYRVPSLLDKHFDTNTLNQEFRLISDKHLDSRKDDLLFYYKAMIQDFREGKISSVEELIQNQESIEQEYSDVIESTLV